MPQERPSECIEETYDSTYLVLVVVTARTARLVVLLVLLLFLPPHVPVQDAHEVGCEIPNRRSFHRGQLIDRPQGVLFGEHLHLRLDLFVPEVVRGTKALPHEFLELLVDGWRQLVPHRNVARGAIDVSFLNDNVPLDDPKEVGPVVADRSALDLDGVVVFLEGVVDDGDRSQAPELFQELPSGLFHDGIGNR